MSVATAVPLAVSASLLSTVKVASSLSVNSAKSEKSGKKIAKSSKKTTVGDREIRYPKRAISMPQTATVTASKVKHVTPSMPKGNHPPYAKMVATALAALNDRKGSPVAAIFKYIMEHYPLGDHVTSIRTALKNALKRGLADGSIVATSDSKRAGFAGRFRVVKKPSAAKKVVAGDTEAAGDGAEEAKKTAAVKTKKTRTPKKPVAKKSTPAKKAASKKKTPVKPAESTKKTKSATSAVKAPAKKSAPTAKRTKKATPAKKAKAAPKSTAARQKEKLATKM